jgi:hypothetical protein
VDSTGNPERVLTRTLSTLQLRAFAEVAKAFTTAIPLDNPPPASP